jgi:hypothetical protein
VTDGFVLSAPVLRAAAFGGEIRLSGQDVRELAGALGAGMASPAPSTGPFDRGRLEEALAALDPWYLRVAPDGSLEPLFEEGSPEP